MSPFTFDVGSSPGYWLATANHALEKAFNEELAPHGITIRQAQVIGWLVVEPDISQARLARRMRIEAPTLHGILARMERDGWIEREPSTEDRRCNRLRPNEKILPQWERMVACARRVEERATRGLTRTQLETLKRTVAVIRGNLEESSA
jgi:MarR family transcriptional regulator for hemolysin